jgi:hypothetical protein
VINRSRLFQVRLLRHAALSNRVRFAMIAAVLSSLGGFAMSISLAHRLDLPTFGNYAVSMSALALAIGFVHAGFAEPMLSSTHTSASFQSGIRRASLAGLLAAVAFVPFAMLFH